MIMATYKDKMNTQQNKGVKTMKEILKGILKEGRIKAYCPKCEQDIYIFPEHLGRAYCENCDVELIKA